MTTNKPQTNHNIQEIKELKNNTFGAKAPSKKNPMNPEELNDGEITYEVEGAKPRSTKPKGRHQKVVSIIQHLFTLQGKKPYITKQLTTLANDLMDLSLKVCITEEKSLLEVKARIDIAYWHYSKLGIKEFGLAKVFENWDIILNDWNKEKKKHNTTETE